MAAFPNTPSLPGIHHLLPIGEPLEAAGFSAAATPATMPGKPLSASLRALVERRIERLIAILDLIDGDPDLEPTMGAPDYKGTPCIDVGRWMAEHLERSSTHGLSELYRVEQLSQVHWGEGVALDETEEVSEDEDEEDCNPDSEDDGQTRYWAMMHYRGQMGMHDWKAEQEARERNFSACEAAIDRLRDVQRRNRQPTASRLF